MYLFWFFSENAAGEINSPNKIFNVNPHVLLGFIDRSKFDV